MKRFEYCYFDFEQPYDVTTGMKRLNELGQSGWQLIQIVAASNMVRFYMMHELPASPSTQPRLESAELDGNG